MPTTIRVPTTIAEVIGCCVFVSSAAIGALTRVQVRPRSSLYQATGRRREAICFQPTPTIRPPGNWPNWVIPDQVTEAEGAGRVISVHVAPESVVRQTRAGGLIPARRPLGEVFSKTVGR